ncbi:MAG: translation elongation factor Ts, partial [Xanthomonadaceae bacterium]|nr:translation elongation factor Ts [Xanthomonadaceae bacterium]
RGVAMHIAAMNPQYVAPENAPAEFVAKEKEISLAQMSDKDKQKPAEIQEKMIAGKIRKTLNEISLTGQPFVLDTNVTVGDALAKAKAKVLSFHRIAVGEGIEKVVEDYAAEVMKQAGLA